MADLTTRTGKGSALTFAELDNNFVEVDRRTGRGWNDLVSDITVRSGAGSAPDLAAYRDGIYAYSFNQDVLNECFANFHLRHDYIPGTMIYPHIHWTANTTTTGVVRFGVEYTLARRGDSTGLIAFGATQTIYIEHVVGAGEQYLHHVSETTDGNGIVGTNLEVDSLILCRIFRDAGHSNDTFIDPVFMLTADMHYECDAQSTPLRSPPFF